MRRKEQSWTNGSRENCNFVSWLLILKLARMTSSAWPYRYNTISQPVYLNGHWYQIAALPSQIDSLRLAAGGEIFFLQSSQIIHPRKKMEEECTGREGWWCCCCLTSDMAFRCACVLIVQTLLSAHHVCVSPVEWKAEIVVIFKTSRFWQCYSLASSFPIVFFVFFFYCCLHSSIRQLFYPAKQLLGNVFF